jgi:hypothetical protein
MKVRIPIGFSARFMRFKPFAMAQPTGIPSGMHIEDIHGALHARRWTYPPHAEPPPREFVGGLSTVSDPGSLLPNPPWPRLKITWRRSDGSMAGSTFMNAPDLSVIMLRNSVMGGVFFRGVGLDPENQPITGNLTFQDYYPFSGVGGSGTAQQFTRTWTETTTETWMHQGTEFANQTIATHTQVCTLSGTNTTDLLTSPRWRVAWLGDDNRLWWSVGEIFARVVAVNHSIAEETHRQWIIGADGTRRMLYTGMPTTVTRSTSGQSVIVLDSKTKKTIMKFPINPMYAFLDTWRWTGVSFTRTQQEFNDRLSDFTPVAYSAGINYLQSQQTSLASGPAAERITSSQYASATMPISMGVAWPTEIPSPVYPVASYFRVEDRDGIRRETERTGAPAFPLPIPALIDNPAWMYSGTHFGNTPAYVEAELENILGPLGLAGGTLYPNEESIDFNVPRGQTPITPTLVGATTVAAAGFNSRPGASARTLTSQDGAEVTADLRVDATDTDDATKASLRWIADQHPTYPEGVYGGRFSISARSGNHPYGARGECRWTPPRGWYGTTYATYRICDGYDFSNPITLTLVSEQT